MHWTVNKKPSLKKRSTGSVRNWLTDRRRFWNLPVEKILTGSISKPLATLCPIWPARDLILRPPAPETNALPLDQLACIIILRYSWITNCLIIWMIAIVRLLKIIFLSNLMLKTINAFCYSLVTGNEIDQDSLKALETTNYTKMYSGKAI